MFLHNGQKHFGGPSSPTISIGSSNSQQKAMAKLLKFSQSWFHMKGRFSCWPLHLLDHLFLLKIPHYLSFRCEDYRKLNRKMRKIAKFSTNICASLGIEKVIITTIDFFVVSIIYCSFYSASHSCGSDEGSLQPSLWLPKLSSIL